MRVGRMVKRSCGRKSSGHLKIGGRATQLLSVARGRPEGSRSVHKEHEELRRATVCHPSTSGPVSYSYAQ